MERKLITTAIVMAIVSCSFAELVSDESIEQAAASWLSSDRVAQMTMKGLSFEKLEHRGSLRVVCLSPTGYIIMSGSDIADPVISFSRNNFVEPEEVSPFHAMLEHSDSNVQKHEEVGGVRAAKWMELIGGRDGAKPDLKRLLKNSTGYPSTVLVEPFMTLHWSQWQPYNDFAPVYDPDIDDQSYRNRCPCGCTATATAQQIAHCQWPWNTGRTDTWVHPLDANGEKESDGSDSEREFVVRFDGHVPFNWDSLLDVYTHWWGDARGRIAESERFPIARLVTWVDVITKMNFGRNGSNGGFWDASDFTKDWYETRRGYNMVESNDEGVAETRADLELGFPVHVIVPGHAVVAHGFASDGESTYLYLNCGSGSSSHDGWYKLYDSTILEVHPGFRPKKMVQVEPLPKVCDGDVEVKWHLPPCHDNAVTGFEVEVREFGNDLSDEVCDFTRSVGIASNPQVAYVTNNVGHIENDVNFVCENDTDFLWWNSYEAGTYDLPGERILTGSSVLSYRLSSSDVGDREVEILASFDGGEWQTVSAPLLNRKCWSRWWIAQSVFLGQHAGKRARFRIKVSWAGGRLFFDDFKVSDVFLPSVVYRATIAPNLRSCSVAGLGAGKLVGVTVKPFFDEGDGLVSKCEFTRIAGMSRIPLPGDYSGRETNDVIYASTEAGGVWGLRGIVDGETTIRAFDAWYGGFDVSLPGKITKQSKLSFWWYEAGYYEATSDCDTISVTFVAEDGEENDFWCITNMSQLVERQLVEIPLSQFAGKSGGLKVVFRHNGLNWAGESDIMRFYSPRISNVAMPVLPEARCENKTYATLQLPRIDSVKGHDGMEIDEGLYREIEIGEDTLRVSCSATVESLCAYPSHLSLMDDNDVSVEKITAGEFLVRMNTSRCTRRSRMILTLAATDANGTTAYRDVSLRFDEEPLIVRLDRWRALSALAGKPVTAFTFDDSNLENTGTGDMAIGGGVIHFVESPFGRALCHDGNGGPWVLSDGELDMPEDWSVLATAKMSETNNTVLYQFGSAEVHHCGLALASGGKNEVTLSYWHPGVNHFDLLSVKVPNATSQYHSYALRAHGLRVELFVDGVFADSTVLPDMPKMILQFLCPIGGVVNTGFIVAAGQSLDDWRMYDVALPDTAIAAYANTLLMLDEERAGIEIGDVVVPERWFKKFYPSGTMSRTALSATAANGRSVWECYVAGLDPTDEDDDLVADITFENGVPKVSIANGEKSNRIYRIYATKGLDGLETPLDVTNVPDLSVEPYGDYRFFRISAELP